MATTLTQSPTDRSSNRPNLVDMNWDPITRIVGSLGIYTKIDFANQQVAECYSTSSIFRGYSIFMKGKDPRDAHFITSRICGICGDNHATCANYAQTSRSEFGRRTWASGSLISVRPPSICSTTTFIRTSWSVVEFCELMVKETNPKVFAKASTTHSPHANRHGYSTIADIMRALNPFTGAFYKEALQISRLTREMFCLMEGRHVHPSTLYPGGVGTVPSVQLFTDYMTRTDEVRES